MMEQKPNENTSWKERFDKRFGGGDLSGDFPSSAIRAFFTGEFTSLISQLEGEKEKWERFGDEYSQGKVAAITASQDLIKTYLL
jgi:hypothetical protein